MYICILYSYMLLAGGHSGAVVTHLAPSSEVSTTVGSV